MIQNYRSIPELDALHQDQHRLLFQNCLGVIEKVFIVAPTVDNLPNGYVAIYESGSTRRLYFNINGTITYIDFGASVDSDEKVKASSDDPTADYLDGKVAKSIVITSEKLELSGDVATPGNSKLYGTSGSGTKGWYDQPVVPVGTAGSQLFVYTGSNQTFTAPTGITKVYLTMCAGGAGGGGSNATFGGQKGGSGGGGGECLIKFPYTVVAGNSYTVIIGAGGTGGASRTNGNDGGDTSFDSFGVSKGIKGIASAGAGVAGGVGGGLTLDAVAGVGGGSHGFKGGNGGANATDTGGGGGGTYFGTGATGDVDAGQNGTGYGSGGSGGGGNDTAGGNGMPGFCLVEY